MLFQLPPGFTATQVRCTKCNLVFYLAPPQQPAPVPDAQAVAEAVPVDTAVPAPASAVSAFDFSEPEPEAPAPRTRSRRSNEDEDDPRARRDASTRRASSGNGALILAGACVATLVLIGVGIGAYSAFFRERPREDVKNEPAPKPPAPAPKPPLTQEEVIRKVKASTVFIRTTLPDGVWFQLVDRDFTDLRQLKVPETVLTKLNSLKDKELPRAEFLKELPKVLNAEELKQFKEVILERAVDLGATGSGFFASKSPGYVVTNAHVIGYGPRFLKEPVKVEVVIDSGLVDRERTVTAKVYGVSVDDDLALLRINERNPPPPLAFGKAEKLIETQEVFVFGYPFGEQLGKEVSVNRTTVSSLRRTNGTLDRVQLAGGSHPGNSGGPVANAKGEIVGVSVSGLRAAETIVFAIPSETVDRFVEDQLKNGGDIQLGKLVAPPRALP
jgi:S1-C subfamily serine protease